MLLEEEVRHTLILRDSSQVIVVTPGNMGYIPGQGWVELIIASIFSGNLLEMQILDSIPDLLNHSCALKDELNVFE